MSTRCQIGFYSNDYIKNIKKPKVLLYKHYDGYPQETLTLILRYLERYYKDVRKSDLYVMNYIDKIDTEYMSAWFMYYIIKNYVKYSIKSNKENLKTNKVPYYPLDGMSFNSYGICTEFHSDIAYYYAISPNKVIVYDASFKEIIKVNILDAINASRNVIYKNFKFDFTPIKNDLYKNYEIDLNDLISLEKYVSSNKNRTINTAFDFKVNDQIETIIGYNILDILIAPLEDIPTKINDKSLVLRTIANYRLKKGC